VTNHRESLDIEFSDTTGGPLVFELLGYDIDTDTEVEVFLNNRSIGHLSRTANNATGSSSFALPSSMLVNGTNAIKLVQNRPGWIWGVTDLVVRTSDNNSDNLLLTINQIERGNFGFNFNGVTNHRESLVIEFVHTSGGSLVFELQGYDIDFATEVEVILNNVSIGHLSTTANNAIGPTNLTLPASVLVNGTNALSIVQGRPGWVWGVTDLLLR